MEKVGSESEIGEDEPVPMDEMEACLMSLYITEDNQNERKKEFCQHDFIQMDHIYVKNETALEAEDIVHEVAKEEAAELALLIAMQEDFIDEPVETRRGQPVLKFTERIRTIEREVPPSLTTEVKEAEPTRRMKVKDVERLFGATLDLYGLWDHDHALVISILQSLIHFGEKMEIITVVVHRKRSATTLDFDVHAHHASILNLTESHTIEKLLKEKRNVIVLIEQSRNHVKGEFCLHIAVDSSSSCKLRRHAKVAPVLSEELEKKHATLLTAIQEEEESALI